MEKINKLTSENIVQQNIERLQEIFPTAFAEGKLVVEELQALIGEYIEQDKEFYQMTWAGKTQAKKEANKVSTATLRPNKADSKDWDTTGNIFIEGDNLEVLKLLQKTYSNKIKMIYIDPPYNTGKDFVYKDNYKDNLTNYLELTGQTDEEGKKLSTNTDSDGRYHSNWLNMMYPRLKLSRNLMTDDGVIFISIDDNEQANLKKLCDEVFGEENFIANVIWERSFAPINLKKHFSTSHDFIICYSKNINISINNGLKRSDEGLDRYKNPDNDPRGVWQSDNFSVGPAIKEKIYEITTPGGRKIFPPDGRCWLLTKERYEEFKADNRIWFGEDGNNVPRIKRFLSEVKQSVTPMSIWKYTEVGHSQDAAQKLKKIFNGKDYFDYPKSIDLIKRCIELYSDNSSYIIDFFAGSGTTAQAVMTLNAKDGGNRKCISVQLPEPTDEKSEAYKAGYKTIAEWHKESEDEKPSVIFKDSGFANDADKTNTVQTLRQAGIENVKSI